MASNETKLGTAVIPVRAPLDELDKDLAEAKGKAEKSASGISGVLGKIKWAAVGAGATALTGALSDMAREGAKDAADLEVLRVAVENAGASWDEAGEPLDAYMTKMRDLAAIDDSDLKPALASLVAVTGDVGKSMELASLAADLAKGKNMSLASASELVGKVAQGNVSMLTRYGIILDENATAEEALAELQKRFAGQAEAYGATTAGQIDTLGLKIGDFRESIGQATGPAMGFLAVLPGMSTGFSLAGGAVGHVLPILGGFSSTLTATVIPSIGATIVALGPILIPLAAIGAAVALLALAWSQNWFDIQGKTQAVLGVLGPAFEGFRTMVLSIWEGLVTGIKANINAIIGAINGLFGFLNAISIPIPEISIPGTDIRLGGGFFEPFNLASIPYLASGGIAMRPTLAVIGDRGPEAVVPLNSRNGGIIDYDRLADAFARALDKRPTYRIDAHYQYQDERSLRNDISLLQMLGATT